MTQITTMAAMIPGCKELSAFVGWNRKVSHEIMEIK